MNTHPVDHLIRFCLQNKLVLLLFAIAVMRSCGSCRSSLMVSAASRMLDKMACESATMSEVRFSSKAVSGWDPHKETKKFNPYMPVKNVTRDYPPTLLIHGTKDTDVPYEQSVMMAKQLKQHGVEHQLVTIPGGEHGLGGGDPKLIDAAYKSAGAFVDRYLSS